MTGKHKASAKPANTQKALAKALAAVEKVCRETDDTTQGNPIIADLATWEIEARIKDAITEALRK